MTPTCVSCNAVFAPNHDLASMPHGKRIAFDPELGRVWRICTKCGEWNLLGADATAAVIAEVTTRLPLISAGAIVHDAIGAVRIITVSTDPEAIATSPHAARAREWFSRLRLLDGGTDLMLTTVFLAGILPLLFDGQLSSRLHYLLPITIGLAAGWTTGQEAVRWRRTRRVELLRLCLGGLAGGIAVAVALAMSKPTTAIAVIVLIILTIITDLLADHAFGRLTGRLVTSDSGDEVWIELGDADRVDIGLADDGTTLVAWHERGKHRFTGLAAHAVLEAVGTVEPRGPAREDVEHGWVLLRTHATVARVVAAIGEARPDDAGRHPLVSLPPAWQVAVHFGVIEASGTDAERDAIREQIAAASEVAAIAESLDAPRLN